jgi:uncharacterized membrane protein
VAADLGGPLPAAPIRWTIRALALIATLVAAYLAWKAIALDKVAGCTTSTYVDCDLVLQSAWSKWLGIPVAFLGLVTYATLLGLSFAANQNRSPASRWISTALVMVALVVAGAGIWFDALQVFSVEKFCIYCIAVHLCGLAIAGLVLWSTLRKKTLQQGAPQLSASRTTTAMAGTLRPMASPSRSAASAVTARPSFALAAIGAAALLGLLIGGQILFPPKVQVSQIVLPEPVEMNNTGASVNPTSGTIAPSPSAEEHIVNRIPAEDSAADPKSSDDAPAKDHTAKHSPTGSAVSKPDAPALSRKVSFLKGSLTIDMYQQAVIGSPTAPHVVIEIVDYACPHCRAMHKTIMQAVDRYGDQLAIVIMPMPLELECNKNMPSTEPAHFGACKLARLALAMSEVDPAAFVDFHEWLMADKDKVPEVGRAISKAYRLADAKKLRERVDSDEIEQRIQNNINLYSSVAQQQASGGKKFGLPVQILGDEVISGDTVSGDELLSKWEEILGMKPQ